MTNEQRTLAMKDFESHLVTSTMPRFKSNDDDGEWNPLESASQQNNEQADGEDEVIVQEDDGGSDSDYESYDVGQSVSLIDVVPDEDNVHGDKEQPPSHLKVLEMLQTDNVSYEIIAGNLLIQLTLQTKYHFCFDIVWCYVGPQGDVWNRFDLGSEVMSLARTISSFEGRLCF